MESEIIPMCEDQGMAIVSWASLGGGQLATSEQRQKMENDPDAGKGFYSATEGDIKVCDVLERLAKAKNATLQDIVSVSRRKHSPWPTNSVLGIGIPIPPVNKRLPHCWCADC